MKLSVIFILGILCSSSIAATDLATTEGTQRYSMSFSFSEPSFVEDGTTLQILMEGASACFYQSGQPVLPMATTTIQLPFGSKIRGVSISFDNVKTKELHKKITLAPAPSIQRYSGEQLKVTMPEDDSSNVGCYPTHWITYSTGGGLNEQDTHVTFLSIRVFPVRYNQTDDTVLYLDSCDVMITYEEPVQYPFPSEVTNDLIIICPVQFLQPLRRLAEHKNMVGVRTEIKTLGEIYQTYPGYDRPEQIKYCIKDMMERLGTTYVLLVGGLKSHFFGKPRDNLNTGTRDWHLPVRYSNLWDDDDFLYDPGFISDLYYADVYDGQGGFCSWNSFNDGVYGGWSHYATLNHPSNPIDQIDFYPDIYIGRLPCRNLLEVCSVVNKIISYETKSAGSSWFKKMVVVGGDPYDDQGMDYLEGELICEKALSYMTGFEQQKLFSSNKEMNPAFTPTTQNVVREINQGCGFLFFDGHGGPNWWNTFWPGEFGELIEDGGISVPQFHQLKNKDKLPVCIVGGCHNNLFNVSVLSTVTDPWNKRFSWSNGIPLLECWGWSLVAKPSGGAIAVIGNTGLGYEAGGEVGDLNGDGINEPDCVESLCGYLETRFFKGYQLHQIDVLGKTWCRAISDYLHIYPGMEQWSDAKTLEQWVLFGDPSLKIGGYS